MERHMPELPLIDRTKITAELLVPLVKQMEVDLGREQAHAIVRKAIGGHYRRLARDAFAAADGDPTRTLLALNSGVRMGEDIEVDLRPRDDGFEMDVTACVYARFFQAVGEPELGFLLMCSADDDMVAEMSNVELDRSQTIMQGADHCDFRYRFLSTD